jgi:hypothetical protein
VVVVIFWAYSAFKNRISHPQGACFFCLGDKTSGLTYCFSSIQNSPLTGSKIIKHISTIEQYFALGLMNEELKILTAYSIDTDHSRFK